MIRICLYISALFLFIESSVCQNLYDAQWVLGYDISSDLDDCFLTNIKFVSDQLEIDTITCKDEFLLDGGNSSMCDKNGNLLFYTNGCDILNRNGKIMKNGEVITPGYVEDIWCGFLGHPFPSTILSLPQPCSDNIYHLFSIDLNQQVILGQEIGSTNAPLNLFHNIIDITKENGLGEAIVRDEIIIQDTLSNGHIKATLHKNGLDWWVSIPEALSNCIYTFLLTQDGISSTKKICKGHVWNNASAGSSSFSPNGKYYARLNFQNGLHILEFDNKVGEFSKPIEIQFPNDTFPTNSGLSFSPNSRFLYVSARESLYQFDMESDNISSSRILVAEYDGFVNISSTIFHNSQLARDGKIYIGVFAQHRNLHVIHNPNLKGLACEVEQHAIELPTINGHGMPNIPFYPSEFNTSLCSVGTTGHENDRYNLTFFPNPTSGTIKLKGTVDIDFTLKIYTVDGLLLVDESIRIGQEIDISNLPPGLLIYNIMDKIEVVQTGKLAKVIF